ncbi:hypothetical protein [Actinomadura rudentiformis]|uniref:Uncharacterized protein n=1 Tax=Actinomadura rudentiformis TaxID=359158 RepID=A0A6H9Z258_9ACTN|nr:hypothetical protein [Actinomadura rudentiformis]KAB2347347.1 hypothetical protein F8566_20255 [Actinomadura rudentiformis]
MSDMAVGLLEVDSGDAPSFTITVNPYDNTTAMTAQITSPAGTVTPFTMTGSGGGQTWTGNGPILTELGEYTAKFTVTGTGAGVHYYTVIVATPPPLTSDLRRLRLLIADTNPANRIFRVDELADFLDLEGGNVKLAAAQALGVIATSEVLISKVIRTQDLSTDGAKVAAELRARAADLRQQAGEGDGDDSVGFDIVDMVHPWNRRGSERAEFEEI